MLSSFSVLLVLSMSTLNSLAAQIQTADPRISALVDSISAERIGALV